MGRTNREMKRTEEEEKNSMQVAFCRKRKSLFKKAKQLSALCEADVGLFIFSNCGRLHAFSSSGSLTGIVQRYESHVEVDKKVAEEVQDREPSEYSSVITTREPLQTIGRQLRETNVDGLSVTDLIHRESQLEAALIQIRSKKTNLMAESVEGLHEKEKVLREENKHLKDEIARIKEERGE